MASTLFFEHSGTIKQAGLPTTQSPRNFFSIPERDIFNMGGATLVVMGTSCKVKWHLLGGLRVVKLDRAYVGV